LKDRRGGFTSDFLAGRLRGKVVKEYLDDSLEKVMTEARRYEGNLLLTSTPSRRPNLVRNICSKMKHSGKKILQFYQEAQEEPGMGRFEGLERKFAEMLEFGFDGDIVSVVRRLDMSSPDLADNDALHLSLSTTTTGTAAMKMQEVVHPKKGAPLLSVRQTPVNKNGQTGILRSLEKGKVEMSGRRGTIPVARPLRTASPLASLNPIATTTGGALVDARKAVYPRTKTCKSLKQLEQEKESVLKSRRDGSMTTTTLFHARKLIHTRTKTCRPLKYLESETGRTLQSCRDVKCPDPAAPSSTLSSTDANTSMVQSTVKKSDKNQGRSELVGSGICAWIFQIFQSPLWFRHMPP